MKVRKILASTPSPSQINERHERDGRHRIERIDIRLEELGGPRHEAHEDAERHGGLGGKPPTLLRRAGAATAATNAPRARLRRPPMLREMRDEQRRRHRHLPQHLHDLHHSGFGLIKGEVGYLSSTLIVVDITLAGLFWGVDEDRGELNILAGGDPAAVERVRPLLEVLGGRIWNVGIRPQQPMPRRLRAT
jgi:hypothetical protein